MSQHKKLLGLLTILFFMLIGPFWQIPSVNANGENWLTGWSYRKSHVINNATGAGTNYQMRVTLYPGTGTDSGNNVYLNNHAQTDLDDVRFTDNDGSTLLDYWMEGTGSISAPSVGDTSTVNTATYDAFGFMVKNGTDSIVYFYRQGTTHAADKGKIVERKYVISTKTWESTTADIYTDSTYDSRNLGGGIIGNNIFIFFMRYNYTGDVYHDIGYIKSTDLTASSWGSYTIVGNWSDHTNFSPFGGLIEKGTTDTWYQTIFDQVTGGNYSLKMLTSTDGGANWSVGVTIYSGTAWYNEGCGSYVGDNKIIVLSRRDTVGEKLHQFTSNDGGDTWVDAGTTNLGYASAAEPNVPWTYYDIYLDRIIVLYTERWSHLTRISQTDPDIVFTSPTSYDSPIDAGTAYQLGYGSLIKVSDGNFFWSYAKEISSNDADTLSGWYYITITPAIFWVEIADSLESSAQTIYVYYGNSAVSTTSNGANTFLFFDDFANLSQWTSSTASGGTVTVSAGLATCYTTTTASSKARIYTTSTFAYASMRCKTKVTVNAVTQNNKNLGWSLSDFSKIVDYNWDKASAFYAYTQDSSYTLTSLTAPTQNYYHTWEIKRQANSAKFYVDDNSLTTITTNVPSANLNIMFDTHNAASTAGSAVSIIIDWTFIRKYIVTEPSHGSWGSEETPPVHALNLRVMDWDLMDAIGGATVYKDTDTKTSNAGGWANWTGVLGTVAVKVKYFGFWVNGTFSVEMTSDKTINVQCKLYDVTVTAKPNNEIGVISGANVTAYNNTGTSNGKIKSGITASITGQATLTNLPNATLRFIMYAKSDYSIIIANTTQLISSDDYSFNIVANQNYVVATLAFGYEAIIWMNALSILHLLSIISIIVRKILKKNKGGEKACMQEKHV